MKPATTTDFKIDWKYATHYMGAAAATYVFCTLIYVIVLAIYHFCVFLPRTRRHIYREEEVVEPDTKSKLIRIAKKHNQLDKTQEEDSIQKTAEGEGTLERTQSQEEITTAKQISKEGLRKYPSKERPRGITIGSPLDHQTAKSKSNTSTVVSRRQGKRDKTEPLLLQVTQSDTD